MSNNNNEVRLKNIREVRVYITLLDIKGILEPLDKSRLDEYERKINESISKNENKEEIKKSVKNTCMEILLPDQFFSWIHEDDRIINYVWGRILKLDIESIKHKKWKEILDYHTGQTTKINKHKISTYDELKFNKNPSNKNEKLDIIIMFFDLIDLDITKKESLLNKIKDEWIDAFNNGIKFKWLNIEDKETCEWAWEYINKHSNYCHFFSPICNDDWYLFFYAAFDLWDASQDTKKLFSININKAISQQKFRAGIKNKKALNTFIDKKAKEKLEILSKIKNMRINQVIEYLIENEFNKREKTKGD